MLPRSPVAIETQVVDSNQLASGLLAEKLRLVGIDAQPLASLQAARALAPASGRVILWLFNWQYQSVELTDLKRLAAGLDVLVLGTGCSRVVQAQLLLCGARGFVDQSEPFDHVVAALERVARGARHFTDDVLSDGIDLLRQRPVSESAKPLTEREQQIVGHIVHGRSNKEIAAALHVSESTIKSHLQTIFSKLGVNNRLALAMQALNDPAALQARRRPVTPAASAAGRPRSAPSQG